MGSEEAGRSFCCTARAADRLLRVILLARRRSFQRKEQAGEHCSQEAPRTEPLNHYHFDEVILSGDCHETEN